MRRRPKRRLPRLARPLVGAFLALVAVLAPVESADLPDPLDDYLDSAEAVALPSTVQPGDPDSCDGWATDEDVCWIEQAACPYSPFSLVGAPSLMQRSTEFPEFCEETLDDGDPNYGFCTGTPVTPGDPPQTYPGFAVIVGVDPVTSVAFCRMLQLSTCEIGTRIDSVTCRATRRRSWTCSQLNAIPRNEFNTCYVPPPTPASATLACGPGKPDLVVIGCTDYVGDDFVHPPDTGACTSFGAGETWEMNAAGNTYWCEYNASFLQAACHSTPAPPGDCTGSTALCLKRASGTGGCDAVAHAMLCRAHQQDYEEEHTAALSDTMLTRTESIFLNQVAASIRRDGCAPCMILPFEPVPLHCPEEIYEEAVQYSRRVYQFQAIEQQHDITFEDPRCFHLNSFSTTVKLDECVDVTSRCESPTPGNPEWSSTHHSGFAVVNSSIVVRLHDVPITYRSNPSTLNLGRLISGNFNFRNQYAQYPGTGLAANEDLVRTYSRPPSDLVTDSPGYLANSTEECVADSLPFFSLIVEELWPDRSEDRDAILELFGPDALTWWNGLQEAAQRRRTEARGLPWWPSLTTPDEQAARTDMLETKVSCNTEQDVEVWCRWVPSRSGYYRVKVGGGWLMNIGRARGWYNTLDNLRTRVGNLTEDKKDQVRDSLEVLGCGPDRAAEQWCALPPTAVGLNTDLTDLLPYSDDVDDLYRSPGDHVRFEGFDIRKGSTDGGSTAKYTETPEFGIQVHAVRVSTVIPTR